MNAPAVGQGIYSVATASRLLGIPSSDIARWSFGYRSHGRRHPPVLITDLPEIDGHRAITFLELVEVMLIRGLRERGHSLQEIRRAWEVLRRVFRTDHPFALRICFEEPAGVYALIERETGEDLLVELRGHAQVVMFPAVEEYLRQLEFEIGVDAHHAARWHPAGREKPIVVDPAIAFGAPVIAGTAISTAVIAQAHATGSNADEIAWLYDVDAWKVDAALDYERSMRAA